METHRQAPFRIQWEVLGLNTSSRCKKFMEGKRGCSSRAPHLPMPTYLCIENPAVRPRAYETPHTKQPAPGRNEPCPSALQIAELSQCHCVLTPQLVTKLFLTDCHHGSIRTRGKDVAFLAGFRMLAALSFLNPLRTGAKTIHLLLTEIQIRLLSVHPCLQSEDFN